jgi:hypothetical protein
MENTDEAALNTVVELSETLEPGNDKDKNRKEKDKSKGEEENNKKEKENKEHIDLVV